MNTNKFSINSILYDDRRSGGANEGGNRFSPQPPPPVSMPSTSPPTSTTTAKDLDDAYMRLCSAIASVNSVPPVSTSEASSVMVMEVNGGDPLPPPPPPADIIISASAAATTTPSSVNLESMCDDHTRITSTSSPPGMVSSTEVGTTSPQPQPMSPNQKMRKRLQKAFALMCKEEDTRALIYNIVMEQVTANGNGFPPIIMEFISKLNSIINEPSSNEYSGGGGGNLSDQQQQQNFEAILSQSVESRDNATVSLNFLLSWILIFSLSSLHPRMNIQPKK